MPTSARAVSSEPTKRSMPATPLDILAEELGIVAGRIEREAGLRIDAALADLRRVDAEREVRLAALERAVAERLAAVKDGQPGANGASVTIEQLAPFVQDVVASTVEALPKAKDGASITLDDVAPLIAAEVERAVGALPAAEKGDPGEPGKAGEPGAPGAGLTLDDVAPLIAAEVERAVGALPPAEKGDPGEPGKSGRLAIVKAWSNVVHYEGIVVTHAGATWQALKDTGREPPHEDWICLASAGQNGRDGRSARVRDTFDPKVEDYRELDIVALSGAAFIARHDAPGPCPGAGWQLIAMQGKTGKPGERGAQGLRGAAAPVVAGMSVGDDGMLTLSNADGSIVKCDLYPVLSKLGR